MQAEFGSKYWVDDMFISKIVPIINMLSYEKTKHIMWESHEESTKKRTLKYTMSFVFLLKNTFRK